MALSLRIWMPMPVKLPSISCLKRVERLRVDVGGVRIEVAQHQSAGRCRRPCCLSRSSRLPSCSRTSASSVGQLGVVQVLDLVELVLDVVGGIFSSSRRYRPRMAQPTSSPWFSSLT